jgi:serine/threonine protein kinase
MKASPGCPQTKEWDQYRLGTLSSLRQDELEKHASSCDGCRKLQSNNDLDRADSESDAQQNDPALTVDFDPSTAELQQTLITDRKGSETDIDSEVAGDSHRSQAQWFGEYELLGEIARGGMGVVYRARQSKANRIVALKMIIAGQLAREEDIQRFFIETEAAASLEHPNIVPLYDVGEQDGQHYFSMEFVDGESLATRLREKPMPPREAAQLVHSVSEAMAYAHGRGVIHRDLKPANILLDASGNPRITDFGLARREQADSGLTQSGQVIGTPGYMPPEQAAGRMSEVDGRSDVYSIGATLYCTLTARAPFQAASVLETLNQVISQEPVPPGQLNPAVDRDLETICLKCLQKEPQKRYASATDLAEDLRRFLHDEPIRARPVGPAERLRRWCRRNLRIALLSAALVGSSIVGTAVSTTQWLHAEDRAVAATRLTGEKEHALGKAVAALSREQIALVREQEARSREKTLQKKTRRYLYGFFTKCSGWFLVAA